MQRDDVSVSVGANPRPLIRGLGRGRAAIAGFEVDAKRMAGAAARYGALAAVALVGVGAAFVRSTARAAVEIDNLSRLAGTGVEDFQRMAAAADTVGVSQEKLADTLKDVNDKFGDFLSTGQGPLTDFFENIAPRVGVTADQFARLGGPEALQLYVTSLEKAGVSQQQMTFYMEALASDATALVPLLQAGGREMQRLGDQAQRAGRVINQDAVQAGVEMDRKFRELSDTLRTQAQAAILEYSDEIVAAAEFIGTQLIPAIVELIKFVGEFAGAMNPAIAALRMFLDLSDQASSVGPPSVRPNPVDADAAGSRAVFNANGPAWRGLDSGYAEAAGDVPQPGMTRGIPMSPGNNLGVPASLLPSAPVIAPPETDAIGGGGGGGDGVQRGPTDQDLERLRERFMDQREIVQAEYEKQLEELRAFRNAKRITEEEFNEKEAELTQRHQDRLAQIERGARAARLQSIGAAFSDLASLMQSENQKVFRIGQAAAIAEAVVSGYAAAQAAWEKGMKVGGPPVAAAFTAASVAKSAAHISGIAGASPSGGAQGFSSGAGAAAGAGVAGVQPAEQRQTAEFRIFGEFVTTDLVVGALQDAIDQGLVIERVRAG